MHLGNQGQHNRGCWTVLLLMNREIHLPYRQWPYASWNSELVRPTTTYPGDDPNSWKGIEPSTSKTHYVRLFFNNYISHSFQSPQRSFEFENEVRQLIFTSLIAQNQLF